MEAAKPSAVAQTFRGRVSIRKATSRQITYGYLTTSGDTVFSLTWSVELSLSSMPQECMHIRPGGDANPSLRINEFQAKFVLICSSDVASDSSMVV